MSIRQTAFALAAIALSTSAFAQTSGVWVNGEIGFVPAQPTSVLTREQVKQELKRFVAEGGTLGSGEFAPTVAAGRSLNANDPSVLGNAPAPQVSAPSEPFVNGGPN